MFVLFTQNLYELPHRRQQRCPAFDESWCRVQRPPRASQYRSSRYNSKKWAASMSALAQSGFRGVQRKRRCLLNPNSGHSATDHLVGYVRQAKDRGCVLNILSSQVCGARHPHLTTLMRTMQDPSGWQAARSAHPLAAARRLEANPQSSGTLRQGLAGVAIAAR